MTGMRQPRTLILTTSQGDHVLFIRRMTVNEELGRLFQIELELVSERSDLNLEDFIAQNVTLRVEPPGGTQRVFNGHITRFGQAGMTGQLHAYRATVHPWLWFLTRNADCRIFQHQTVPDIVKQVFRDRGFTDFEERLSGSYRPWDYCVQYRETDFNFVNRLLENEGIYYYFKHEAGKHILVLSDSVSAHSRQTGYEKIPYFPPDTHPRRERDHIYDWRISHEIQPGAYALDDYDFERPKASLKTRSVVRRPHAYGDFEIYDYPGDYLQSADGEAYARARIEELQWQYRRQQGEGNALGLAVGNLFELTDYPREDQNREYLLVAAHSIFESSAYETLPGGESGDHYQCDFTCIPSDQQYRSPRITPKPIVRGPQTAVVTGKPGEEIWTDEHGRVKVHFHWDRHGKEDENSSCWMRVAQHWAGKSWGAIYVPRIGQEVIVEFFEGDPDRPIITGRVYNGDNMPPYALPANQTQSGVKSRSSKGGTGDNYNEIRFEDKKGAEQILIHAEKNQSIEVEHDETHWVGHDRTKTINHDETIHVKHDRIETVNNNETVTIGVNRSVTIRGNKTETVRIAKAETIGAGKALTIGLGYQVSVGAAMNETVVGAKATEVGAYRTEKVALYKSSNVGNTYTMDVGGSAILMMKNDGKIDLAGSEIKLHTNGGSLLIKDDGTIVISGTEITLKTGGGSINIKNDGTIQAAGTDCTTKAGAGKVHIDAGGIIEIKGPMVKINT